MPASVRDINRKTPRIVRISYHISPVGVNYTEYFAKNISDVIVPYTVIVSVFVIKREYISM